MKVFIIGYPKSGRTTVAKSLKYIYIDASSWIRSTFRAQKINESTQRFNDLYHEYLMDKLQLFPSIISNHVNNCIISFNENNLKQSKQYVIDGIFSPIDFIQLFNHNEDIVIFLNRIDNNDIEFKDYEKIGVSVIRDYCFWLSSASLLPKARWLEYNFKMSGEQSDSVKTLGSKNTIYIVKSLQKVISHLQEIL